MLPEFSWRTALADRGLARLLPERASRQGILHVVFASGRGRLPGVRAAIDFIAEVLDPRSGALETDRLNLVGAGGA